MKKTIFNLLLLTTTVTIMADGLEVYKKCIGCHGDKGELSALQKSVLIGGQESNLTIKQLTAYKNGELNQYGLGNIMKLQISTLSDEEINSVAEYIETLEGNSSN